MSDLRYHASQAVIAITWHKVEGSSPLMSNVTDSITVSHGVEVHWLLRYINPREGQKWSMARCSR